jgi:hypothetical protein
VRFENRNIFFFYVYPTALAFVAVNYEIVGLDPEQFIL